MFICPDCKGKVENLRCKSCGFYPQNINGILDFRTKDFRGMSIPSEIPDYVKMEDIGMDFRTKNFYIPLVKRHFFSAMEKINFLAKSPLNPFLNILVFRRS